MRISRELYPGERSSSIQMWRMWLASMKNSAAGISAEVLCVTRDSIGYYIYISKQYFETASLFAWTVAIIVLSVLLELAIKKSVGALQRAVRRKYAGK